MNIKQRSSAAATQIQYEVVHDGPEFLRVFGVILALLGALFVVRLMFQAANPPLDPLTTRCVAAQYNDDGSCTMPGHGKIVAQKLVPLRQGASFQFSQNAWRSDGAQKTPSSMAELLSRLSLFQWLSFFAMMIILGLITLIADAIIRMIRA